MRARLSPQAAVRELLGERQLWWKCCSEAVRSDPCWLLDGDSEDLRAWLHATAPDRAADSLTPVDHAWLLGRALSAPGDLGGERNGALAALAESWRRSGLLSADAVRGPAQPSGKGREDLSPRVASGLRGVVEWIQDQDDSTAEDGELAGAWSMLVIAMLLMAGAQPHRRSGVSVPVVFGRSAGPAGPAAVAEGVTGVLELCEFPRARPACIPTRGR
ncbi:hypothetical protein GCM10020000_85800 [Streptomyces olivoverticillatus]